MNKLTEEQKEFRFNRFRLRFASSVLLILWVISQIYTHPYGLTAMVLTTILFIIIYLALARILFVCPICKSYLEVGRWSAGTYTASSTCINCKKCGALLYWGMNDKNISPTNYGCLISKSREVRDLVVMSAIGRKRTYSKKRFNLKASSKMWLLFPCKYDLTS